MNPTARVVLKLGGELLMEPDQRRDIAAAIGSLAGGAALVVVHGGGREVDAELGSAASPSGPSTVSASPTPPPSAWWSAC